MKKTSIIILTYNQLDYTKDCIESIRKYTEENTYEIIIVDNNSTDGTKEWLKDQKDLKIIYNKENVGFPKGCNQGISITNKKNDILLLNNDTIVTENWLKNLKICLESKANIGAVGSVCNQNENKQGVDFTYENFDEMQLLAKKNNQSDPERWEEKTFLIGFCLLIKREVMNKLKQLDETFSPGYIEDNDLSLRIIQLGYKLLLCHDSFVHHYLGTSFRKNLDTFYPILNKNRDYFFKKWHFSTFAFDELKSLVFPLQPHFHVLELNCGIGVTLLTLKYQYKNVYIEGVEKDVNKRVIAKNFAKVYQHVNEIKDQKYDCIFLGNILETIQNPYAFLKKLKSYLKKDGFFIGEIHNFASIKNLNTFFHDSCSIIKKYKNNYTITDLKELFQLLDCHDFRYYSWYEYLENDEKNLYDILKNYYPNILYTYYTFCVK